MTEMTASRTLVKSPPELWAECSDAASLGRHLMEHFGEIRITRLEPETAVAWEGERASGTVRLEPSGWGTRVVLTAELRSAEPPASAGPAALAEAPADLEKPTDPPEPAAAVPEPAPGASIAAPRRRPFARLMSWLRRRSTRAPAIARAGDPVAPWPDRVMEAPADPHPPVGSEPEAAPEEPSAAAPDAVLEGALDSLGQAHHRPFSRA